MTSCAVAPRDKKLYAQEVGAVLVRDYGRKRYYSPDEVKRAAAKTTFAPDYSCWAMSLYTSPEDFRTYHEAMGEICDYAAMKEQMAAALTDGASCTLFDVGSSWLEWPSIELPSLFDFGD